jgi:sugar O-acyltransferase (sialic acid O-acetyltransferase NeuD family)
MSDCVRYVIWGSAGHAKVLSSIIKQLNGRVVAIFDNNTGVVSVLRGVPLYNGIRGFEKWLSEEPEHRKVIGMVAIGGSNGRYRLNLNDLFKRSGLQMEALVHPQAFVCETAQIGKGTQVLAKAVVAADSKIGEACIINHCASVDHECVIGNGVHLAPGVTLCGCVKIENFVMIGAGTVVLPRVDIGKNTIVGAGSVVTHNLPDNIVAVGSPARILRRLQ